jgi:hypothetical protein
MSHSSVREFYAGTIKDYGTLSAGRRAEPVEARLDQRQAGRGRWDVGNDQRAGHCAGTDLVRAAHLRSAPFRGRAYGHNRTGRCAPGSHRHGNPAAGYSSAARSTIWGVRL